VPPTPGHVRSLRTMALPRRDASSFGAEDGAGHARTHTGEAPMHDRAVRLRARPQLQHT
jgi:hypothetical protein